MAGRSGLAIRTELAEIRPLPADVDLAAYRIVDRTAKPRVRYTYQLQVVYGNGKRTWAAKTTVQAR